MDTCLGKTGAWEHFGLFIALCKPPLKRTKLKTKGPTQLCSLAGAVGERSLFAQPLAAPENFTPIFLSRLRQNESQYQQAASQCRGSKECIYDMLSTGDVTLGLATQSLVEDFQEKKTALSKWSRSSPPRGHGMDNSSLGPLAPCEAREMPPRSWIFLHTWEMPPAGQMPPRS